jgi:GAF domain-containing protein
VLLPLSKRLHAARTFEEAVDTILDDTIALLGAEYGNVQLPIGDALAIVAQRGLSGPFLRAFRRVRKDDDCACGRALRHKQTVVVSDVESDADFAAFLKMRAMPAFARFKVRRSLPATACCSAWCRPTSPILTSQQ